MSVFPPDFVAWAAQNILATFLLVVSTLGAAYYLTSSKSNSRSPPLVPYWIPWVGSAVTLGKDPDAFFKRAAEELGPIFSVKLVGRTLTYVTSPALIAAIYRDPKSFEFQSIRQQMSIDVFSVSAGLIRSTDLTDTLYPAHHRLLSPKSIGPILERYTKCAHEQLLVRLSEVNNTSLPLAQLIILPAYVSTAQAFFGEKFDAKSTYERFTKFNDAFHILVSGMPRFLTAGPRKEWDSVIDDFEAYIKVIRKDSDAPELVEMTLSIGDAAGWTDHDHAAIFASELWAMEANAIWAIYWFFVLLLQHPSDYKRVKAEVDSAREKWIVSHPGTQLTSSNFHQFITDAADHLPLMTSGLHETLRLCTSVFSIRRVTTPTEFGGFHFDIGDELICNTRTVHMDEEIHERPQEFILDRYLDGNKRYTKDGNPVLNHSLPFGGGVSMCEGRHFAQAEIKAFIVILLTYASLEVGTKHEAWPTMAMERIGVGLISPRGDVNVVVRKRDI